MYVIKSWIENTKKEKI